MDLENGSVVAVAATSLHKRDMQEECLSARSEPQRPESPGVEESRDTHMHARTHTPCSLPDYPASGRTQAPLEAAGGGVTGRAFVFQDLCQKRTKRLSEYCLCLLQWGGTER